MGMMCGVELDADKQLHRAFANPQTIGPIFINCCWQEGLMVRGGHGKVMAALAPPLTLAPVEADEIVKRIGRALDRLLSQIGAAGNY
jgi:adenosylmethionine-8-amino-7-oxononanoate aminotransferase